MMANQQDRRDSHQPPANYAEDYATRAVAARATQGLPPRVEDSETLELLAQAFDSAAQPGGSIKKSA